MNYKKHIHWLALVVLTLLLSSCILVPPKPGIGKAVEWRDVPGWQNDAHAEAWPALWQNCTVLPARDALWQQLCERIEQLGSRVDDVTARDFFEQYFVAHRINPSGDKRRGLVTGYYEPLLHGSLTASATYRYPLYGRPDDLLRIELADVYPKLKGMKLRGRVVGKRVVPYYTRAEINDDTMPLNGNELLWVDDPVALFFLHIQGSGRVRLPDGSLLGVGYADQNGQPYASIGRTLIERGEIKREDVSLFTIRDWLRRHPQQAAALLDSNRSYVFFQLREAVDENARGALNVPLTPARSIAIDPANIPLGSPVWLDTSYPGAAGGKLQRLTIAQDTGGAIKGYARADLFWGSGDKAERLAGEMKQEAEMYVLLPRVAQTRREVP
jgi:membrane-bound lytic murein transglycosylase A